MPSSRRPIWTSDQFAKSIFFHQKLHDWGLLAIADAIDQIKGETLNWANLSISENAWNKAIHNGIKPVVIFAHPQVLSTLPRAVSYYRMLAMISLKSMRNIGLPCEQYEAGKVQPSESICTELSHLFNAIISSLIEMDSEINPREFDLWRGMAAGTQAQGSWQNSKGREAEVIIKEFLYRRLSEQRLADVFDAPTIVLRDGRRIHFASEPDLAILSAQGQLLAAVEIKGGIDPAGVLERIGAAAKSLIRAKALNPNAVTILVLAGASVTPQALMDLKTNQQVINYWFTVEQLLENEAQREEFFSLLQI